MEVFFMQKRVILIIMVITFLLGCHNKEELSNDTAQGDILGQIDNQPVTEKAFQAYLTYKRIMIKDEKQRKRILDKYIERLSIASVISKEDIPGMDVIMAEINDKRTEILIHRYFHSFLNQNVTDRHVKEYYQLHVAEYEEQKARVSHILIRTNPKMNEQERQAKWTTIREAYSYVNTGRNFEDMARKYSEDKASAKKGGDLGWITKGSINKLFSKTVFELQEGAISKPFETNFGIHIVKLIEGPKTIRKPFRNVKSDIRMLLRKQAKQKEMNRLLKKLKQ